MKTVIKEKRGEEIHSDGLPRVLPQESRETFIRTPMQHSIWRKACYDTICRNCQVKILSTPGAIGPFVRKGMVPTLFLAGAEELAEPIEVAYETEESAESMADEILAQGLPVRLGQPLAHTPFARAFVTRARKAGFLISPSTAGAPFIRLDESWSRGIEHFSAGRRSDFRRMRRRAEAEGEISFQFHVPSPHDVGPLLDQAFEVEAHSWKSRTRTAVACDRNQLGFFRRYAELAAAEGIFRLNFMKIGSRTAAMQIAVECDDRYWLFKIGYDERFAKCSPGQLLMLESIERAARDGLKTFEFLGKAAAWTRVWTESERPRVGMLYYPGNPYGAAAFARDAAVIGSRRLWSIFSEWLGKGDGQRQ